MKIENGKVCLLETNTLLLDNDEKIVIDFSNLSWVAVIPETEYSPNLSRKIKKMGFRGCLHSRVDSSEFIEDVKILLNRINIENIAKTKIVWACEDDPIINELLKRIVRENFHVNSMVFLDGLPILDNWEAVRRRPENFRPDVMILDIVMKHSRGDDICEQLRTKMDCDIPVIALTGNSSHDDIKRYLSIGFDMVLNKPCSSNKILEAVAGVKRM